MGQTSRASYLKKRCRVLLTILIKIALKAGRPTHRISGPSPVRRQCQWQTLGDLSDTGDNNSQLLLLRTHRIRSLESTMPPRSQQSTRPRLGLDPPCTRCTAKGLTCSGVPAGRAACTSCTADRSSKAACSKLQLYREEYQQSLTAICL